VCAALVPTRWRDRCRVSPLLQSPHARRKVFDVKRRRSNFHPPFGDGNLLVSKFHTALIHACLFKSSERKYSLNSGARSGRFKAHSTVMRKPSLSPTPWCVPSKRRAVDGHFFRQLNEGCAHLSEKQRCQRRTIHAREHPDDYLGRRHRRASDACRDKAVGHKSRTDVQRTLLVTLDGNSDRSSLPTTCVPFVKQMPCQEIYSAGSLCKLGYHKGDYDSPFRGLEIDPSGAGVCA
jgi:hypothetical protein